MTGRLPEQALRPGTGSVKVPDRLLTQQVGWHTPLTSIPSMCVCVCVCVCVS